MDLKRQKFLILQGMIKISIVIATYNRGDKLSRTLQSLVGQTLAPKEWEAIVVNNNSTDDTEEIFARFASAAREASPELNLKMVSERRQGLSYARNCGIEAARGGIIAIIDDDEEVNGGFAAAYVDFFARHPGVLMAGGRVVPSYEVARPRWMTRFTERPIAGTLNLGPDERPFRRGYPAGGNMAVRRSAFERFGLFDTSLGRTGGNQMGGEEKELAHRIMSGSPDVAWWVPGAVIFHLIGPEKLTPEYFRKLSRGVGASERVRTLALGRRTWYAAIIKEIFKWAVTLVLAAFYALTGPFSGAASCCSGSGPFAGIAAGFSRASYLIIMRAGITKGLISRF